MKISLSHRFLQFASLTRYYLLVIGFVLVFIILSSIARAFQNADQKSPLILSVVLETYKKITEKSPTPPFLSGTVASALNNLNNGAIALKITTLDDSDEPNTKQPPIEKISENTQKSDPDEESIDESLIITLFPHRKSAYLDEPITSPYLHDRHQDELAMIRIADRIDHSLSIERNNYFSNELGSEEDFDDLHDFSDEDLNNEDFDEAMAYPYLPDPLEVLEEKVLLADFRDLPITQQIDQLITTGDYFLLADDPIKARQYYIQAVKKGARDKSSPFYAKGLVKLADLEENPYLARFQYTNALDIYEKEQGYDLEIADILVKLVWTFDMATERIVILELLTRAKQIHENHPYSPQYTEVLRNLGVYYETVNNFEKAEANYKAALALDLEHLTTNDIRTILALENYAAFYLKYKQYQKAKEVLLFKLDAHEKAESPDYYNLGRTQSMLGWANLQQREFDEALHNYNSALGNINFSITKNRFMPHYYSLPAIFDIIYFFINSHEPERAEPYFTVVVTLLESENEGYILNYLKEAERSDISPEDIIHYPWAAEAEIDGLIAMMQYLDQKDE